MNWLLYDGDCPFCANYVAFLRLRERYPDLELINLRDNAGHRAVATVRERGLVLDDGMAIVSKEGDVIYGADAIAALAQPGTANAWLFGKPGRAARLYPWMKRGRRLVLRMLGRSKLGY